MLKSRLSGFCKMYFSLRRLLSVKKGEIPLLGGLARLAASTILFFLSFSPVLALSYLSEAEAGFRVIEPQNPMVETPLIQENSFLASSNHYLISSEERNQGSREARFLSENELIILERIQMTITAYSSSVWETDDTPFITASGTTTRDGVVASNLLPFNTKLRIPEYFGGKIFITEDRMNQRIGDFQIDVWFPTAQEAKQFGVKHTYIETLQ